VVLYFTWDNSHGRFIGLSSTYFPASSTSQFPLVNYGIYYLSYTVLESLLYLIPHHYCTEAVS
jgi:hypothetical protein